MSITIASPHSHESSPLLYGRPYFVVRKDFRGYDTTIAHENGHLLCDVLQLTDISGPLVSLHDLRRFGSEGDAFGHLVFRRNLHGKLLEKEDDILATLAQGRHLDGDGAQTKEEVLTKLAIADSVLDVHVRGCYDADICLSHVTGAHTDIFARLQHTKQTCLGAQRQFTDLIEEKRAAVG